MPTELLPEVALPKAVLKTLWDGQLYGLRNAAELTISEQRFAPGAVKLVSIKAPQRDGLFRGHLIFSSVPDSKETPEPRGDLSCLQPYLATVIPVEPAPVVPVEQPPEE